MYASEILKAEKIDAAQLSKLHVQSLFVIKRELFILISFL